MSTSKRSIVSTTAAPAAIGPYSQAVRAGDFLFCSGQIPLDPKTGALVEGDIALETRRVMDNLRAVVEAGGGHMDGVVKCGIFLADMNDFAAVNEIYASYFESEPPARATVAVAGLPKGVRVEVDAIVAL